MATRERKTRDVYRIQGRYTMPSGRTTEWETENEEYTYRAARQSLREYRQNGTGEYRLKFGREKL